MLIDFTTFNALSPALKALVAQQVNDEATATLRRVRRSPMTLAEVRRQRSIEFWQEQMGELAAHNVFGDDIIDLLK